MKTHLTRKEVKDLLKVSDRTITRKVRSGEFKCILRNGKQYFPKEQFEEVEKKDKTIVDNTFEMLKEQLEIKDSQIKELQDQLKEKEANHHQQITQQQGIQMQLQTKFLMIEQPAKDRQQESQEKRKKTKKKTKKKETTQPKQKPKQDKQGFWNWFLGKD